jgi:isoquinoline 1-oxidoreductase beta subunit
MNEKFLASSLGRRDFLKLAGAGTAGLVFAIYLEGCTAPPEITPTPTLSPPGTPQPLVTFAPTIYFRLDSLGRLTVTAFRSELGQGIRTAIAMILADELNVDWESVVIEQADADPRFGDQLTGGSVSVSGSYGRLRSAAATARLMLQRAAAAAWGVEAEACSTVHGMVVHPNGSDRLPYGNLVDAAAALELPKGSSVSLKPAEAFTIVGTERGHWDAPAMVTGRAIYGMDIRLPGMLFAALARCPVTGGKPVSFDDAEALKVEGVRRVLAVDNKIAVVAANTWAAIKGRQALKITWDEGKKAALNSEAMLGDLTSKLPQPGSAGAGMLEAIYQIPYEAHETMEPINSTADVRSDRAEVWAPTQDPQRLRSAVAGEIDLRAEAVTVHVTLAGGAFGRRHIPDAAVEAARLSKEVGAPVQVIWTRDDDIQHDYYHPMSVHHASVDLSNPARPRIRSLSNQLDLPTGYWRSVENFPEAFARECFIDEMAAALQRDPLDLRRELFSGRALEVINLAAEKMGWGTPLAPPKGRGMAYHATFGVTHVAHALEIEVTGDGQVHVQRAVCAVDCGRAINPDGVRAQMEGGLVFGLTAALMGGVTIENGRVRESNFHDAPILRIDQMPRVEVHIVESDQAPRGIGEMGVPPAAPALCNAIFAATGKRIRRLPVSLTDLRSA